MDNTWMFVSKFQDVVEKNYFDETLGFEDFWVQVISINGKNVLLWNENQRRLSDDDELNLYDLDNLGNSPMIVSAKIECDDSNGEIIIKTSDSPSFLSGVTQNY